MLKKPTRIEDVGLEKYLDDNHAAAGGYTEFVKRVNLKEPKTIIAKAFGVNKNTIYRWLEVFKEEQGNG